MTVKYVFFDLDGTLLPMDHQLFSKEYFSLITKKFVPFGYDPKSLASSIQNSIAAMVANQGDSSNETVCWKALVKGLGEGILGHKSIFDEFYQDNFDLLKDTCGYDQRAAKAVKYLRSIGIKLVLATNPLFPSIATQKRIEWAGLSADDFEYITVYENSHFSKPNPRYYKEIIETLHLNSNEVIMVGNDVEEDMVASTLGMRTFLVTDHVINRNNIDVSIYPSGSLDDLLDYINSEVAK